MCHRPADRETERQRGREIERQTDRERQKGRDRETDRPTHRMPQDVLRFFRPRRKIDVFLGIGAVRGSDS